ncbi:MAG: radical SAM protein [bacterium]
MAGFLFHEVVFGPVRSRRLGLSLGINLLPTHSKYCSFNCIYCECGWTPPVSGTLPEIPSREEVFWYLEKQLKELKEEDYLPDAITFAGNGEPTIHPGFPQIVEDTISLRNLYAPDAKVTVLSNASLLNREEVFRALLRLDHNIQKLDAGSDRIFRLMNNPVEPVRLEELVNNLKRFHGNVIIQSMFLRGIYKGEEVDNTTDEEVSKWLNHLQEITPKSVMIYPVARATPVHTLEKIPIFTLEKIAEKVRAAGLKVEVYQ